MDNLDYIDQFTIFWHVFGPGLVPAWSTAYYLGQCSIFVTYFTLWLYQKVF